MRFQQKFDVSDFDLSNLHDVYLVGNAEVSAISVSDSWLTLDDFLEDIKLQYSIPKLQIRLEDIRSRTQARDGTISSFIPKIRILLDRLSPKMSLSSQLDRVYRNLHPYYQKAYQFNYFQELLRLGTAEETRKKREKNYTILKPPEQYLFPETAHKPRESKNYNSNSNQIGIATVSQKSPQNKSQSKTPQQPKTTQKPRLTPQTDTIHHRPPLTNWLQQASRRTLDYAGPAIKWVI